LIIIITWLYIYRYYYNNYRANDLILRRVKPLVKNHIEKKFNNLIKKQVEPRTLKKGSDEDDVPGHNDLSNNTLIKQSQLNTLSESNTPLPVSKILGYTTQARDELSNSHRLSEQFPINKNLQVKITSLFIIYQNIRQFLNNIIHRDYCPPIDIEIPDPSEYKMTLLLVLLYNRAKFEYIKKIWSLDILHKQMPGSEYTVNLTIKKALNRGATFILDDLKNYVFNDKYKNWIIWYIEHSKKVATKTEHIYQIIRCGYKQVIKQRFDLKFLTLNNIGNGLDPINAVEFCLYNYNKGIEDNLDSLLTKKHFRACLELEKYVSIVIRHILEAKNGTVRRNRIQNILNGYLKDESKIKLLISNQVIQINEFDWFCKEIEYKDERLHKHLVKELSKILKPNHY